MCRPIIKWVGGKRQLISAIRSNLPPSFNNYFEPFVGGGALFFSLKRPNAHINDSNLELINVYGVVKDNPRALINSLSKHKNTPEHYYEVRSLDRKNKLQKITRVQRASRFIYLNKTGFNGLYRVNKDGQNNVPYGRYKNPKIVDGENILECSKLLQKTTITHGDFEEIKGEVKKGDFVYCDPPYVPLSKTSNFTSYTSTGFGLKEQYRLKEFCDYIDSIGAYFMLSNSFTKEMNTLYKGYEIKTLSAIRSINCKGDGRGKIKELLVTNYQSVAFKKVA